MINLELPKKFSDLSVLARQVAQDMMRPISRKYDTAEHEYPVELDMMASLLQAVGRVGRHRRRRTQCEE